VGTAADNLVDLTVGLVLVIVVVSLRRWRRRRVGVLEGEEASRERMMVVDTARRRGKGREWGFREDFETGEVGWEGDRH